MKRKYKRILAWIGASVFILGIVSATVLLAIANPKAFAISVAILLIIFLGIRSIFYLLE